MIGVVAAVTRDDVATYVDALFLVYIVLIFAYVVSSIIFSAGVRVPYSRWSNALLNFLRDVCEPYLRLFRRFLPLAGPFDLSPLVGTFVLFIARQLVVGLIRG